MKITKKRLEKLIREEIGKLKVDYNNIISENISENQKEAKSLLEDENLSDHIRENYDNIFIPVLGESTNEKRYEARNFDEYVQECYSQNRIDELYATLDESFEYERQFYFQENAELSEVEIIKKGVEKVKGMARKAKETFDRSKLIFFLKLADKGLKLLLAASRSVFSFLAKGAIKLGKFWMKKLAAAKQTISQTWVQLKEWMSNSISKIMSLVMKPFNWLASKIAADEKQAQEIAPILMSITVSAATLAIVISTGGIQVFTSFTDSLTNGIESLLESGGEELAASICGGGGLSEEITGGGCGIVMADGRELTQRQCIRLLEGTQEQLMQNPNNKFLNRLLKETRAASENAIKDFGKRPGSVNLAGLNTKLASYAESIIATTPDRLEDIDANFEVTSALEQTLEKIDPTAHISQATKDTIRSSNGIQQALGETAKEYAAPAATAATSATGRIPVGTTVVQKAKTAFEESLKNRYKELAGIKG